MKANIDFPQPNLSVKYFDIYWYKVYFCIVYRVPKKNILGGFNKVIFSVKPSFLKWFWSIILFVYQKALIQRFHTVFLLQTYLCKFTLQERKFKKSALKVSGVYKNKSESKINKSQV